MGISILVSSIELQVLGQSSSIQDHSVTRLGSLFRRQADTPAGVLEAAKKKPHTHNVTPGEFFG